MKHFCYLLLLLFSVSTHAKTADVSEMSLEQLLEVEIVSSASKMPQKASETPSAVRVITAQDIRHYGWQTLGDALNSLPGISIITNRYYDFIGARGVALPDDYNTRYLMVIDGTPINDALIESAFIGDAFPIDLALIERIEYVPGAGSVAYGANAMLGTINITTKSAKNKQHTEAEASVDSIGRKTLRLTTAQALENGAAITLSASGLHQSGRDQTYHEAIGEKREANGQFTTDGIAHNLDKTRKEQLFAKLEKDALKVSLVLSQRINHPSTAPHSANFDDDAMQIEDQSFALTANYTAELKQNLSLYTNLTYMGYRNTTTSPRFKLSPPQKRYISTQDSDAKRWFAEARLTSKQWQNHQSVIGVDVSQETQNDLLSNDSLGNTQYHDNSPDGRIGVYLQDQWKFTDDWQLHTGLRFDHSEQWGDHLSPRLGLTWQVNPEFTLKAIAARAFRNPNPLEARAGKNPALAKPFESISNLSLQAETVNTRELIAEWRPNAVFELTSGLYYHQLKRLIGATMTPSKNFQFQNLYSIDITGLETAAHYHLASDWKINASLTLQHASNEDGSRAPNAAQWISKLSADGPIWHDQLLAAVELYANGASSQTWEGNPASNHTVILSNLVFTANKWLPKTSVQLRINNLFDRDDTVPGSDDTPVANMPLYGRNASVNVRYEF
jgi:iron complex outermembrane receptor protein